MPVIKYFEILGKVIESNIAQYATLRKITYDAAYTEVVRHLINNSNEWKSGRQPQIPYHDPLCRIAYLYGIAAANANLVEKAFRECTDLQNHIEELQARNDQVCVCAFGGGPGTELLAIAKWVDKNRPSLQITLDYLLLDKVSEWIESWQAIKRQIELRFRADMGSKANWPLTLNGTFSGIDITDTSGFANYGNVFGQDIYIMSYFVSEVFDDMESLKDFTKMMVAHAPINSKFLFIDRNEQKWKRSITEIADEAGISLDRFHDVSGNMDNDESKTDLGKIFDSVKWTPRLTWNAFWVLGTKN